MLKIKNASVIPRRYYGLHMVEGLAEYKDVQHDGQEPFRIFVSEAVCKKMDQTFSGRPVFADHVAQVNLENIEHEADGWVVKSFFNKADGKHWAEFMVVTDRGHEAISKGWKLSNAYVPKVYGNEGTWHAMPYAKEVLDAEYEHLAIVANPRYQESVILTPEEFKNYNDAKEAELLSFHNSLITKEPVKNEIPKGVKIVKNPFKLWNKSEVENQEQAAQMVVTLASGREVSLITLVNEFEEMAKEKKENDEEPKDEKKNDSSEEVMANGDHMVDAGGEKMKLNDLIKKYNEMREGAKKENSEEIGVGKSEALKTPAASQAQTADATKNSLDKLKNAADEQFHNEADMQTIPFDSLSRGKSAYGSGK